MQDSSQSHQQSINQIYETMLPESSVLSRHVKEIEEQIMGFMGCTKYQIYDIPIPGKNPDFIHLIQIESEQPTDEYVYLSHGFGGTSLMYFPGLKYIRKKANVILWEIRGMGLSYKPKSYNITGTDEIIQFFVEGLHKVIDYFKHEKITMISHSFSGYITLRYLIDHKNSWAQQRIKKIILLSPVGITPKDQDYKNSINSCSDILHTIISKLGWTFHLTYKSPMRTICKCLKKKLMLNAFKDYGLSQQQLEKLVSLFLVMVELNDGSENLFFNCFHPRVLPHQGKSIVQVLDDSEYKKQTKVLFGSRDWADQTGAKHLSQKHQQFKVQIVEDTDHMLPLFKPVLEKISEELL